jgi:hypothetical protein
MIIFNNQWIKEELTKEIRKFIEINKNENTTYLSSAKAEIYGYIKKKNRKETGCDGTCL